ncbi:MAG: lamin tail domain-containing protein [Cyclobacteriaceae bacterium]|nr:lamin tail domain-containing protein [Cyclobacteriaceae bacterium]
MIRFLKFLMCLSLAAGCLVFNACDPPKDEVTPVIVEGLFINEIYASGDDWIELYNDLETTKDIGGYFIYDNAANKYKLPASTSIPAKGFLILFCNDLATGLNTNFKLSSDGETVYLENASGTLIDRVEFPKLDNGQSYGRYPDGSTNLVISGNTSKGVSNGDSQAPAIESVARLPIVPGLNQEVTITVKLFSNANIASVKLFNRFNGGAYTAINMSLSGSNYTGILPAKSTVGKMEYYIEVSGTNGKTSFKPASAPANVYDYLLNTDALPQLVVNEFMAYSTSCCPDTSSGINEYDDWIEIYNKGNVAVNIGGMYLSDSKSDPFKAKIPTDNPALTTIAPGGYLLLWADNTPSQGPLHLNFGLSNAGEDVGLFYLDGRTIDAYTYGAQSENISWGRITDGAATWKAFSTPTPGTSNQ